MPAIPNHSRRSGCLLFLGLVALAGCQSAGKQYVFPKESEPAATAVGTSQFFLVNSDHTGCYWGRTSVDANEPVRLKPDVLTQVAQDGSLAARYPINSVRCSSFSSFTPRLGEHYLVKSEGIPTTRSAEGEVVMGRCATGVWRLLPNGEFERVPNEPRPAPTRRGFACLMPEKTAPEKQ